MAYQLEFEKLLSYDVGQPGITLQATLQLKEQSLDVPVKVDTGASCCLFERRWVKHLALISKQECANCLARLRELSLAMDTKLR